MRQTLHDQIEAIAGAIALGEATDNDRRVYREHIASCAACLDELGGEHEIERTAAVITSAREGEVWNPQLRALEPAARRPSQIARFSFGFLATAIVIAAGIRWFQPSPVPLRAETIAFTNAREVAPAPAPQPQRRLVVFHNVVQMSRAPVAALPDPSHSGNAAAASKVPEIAAVTVYPQHASVAVSARKTGTMHSAADWRTISRMTTTALTETAPQRVDSAESLQLGFARRSLTNEAAPIGGETAISPQPPMIAYAEGAEGTTVFQVLIDEHGMPTKCIVTKPAGYRFLDDAVCRAAMKARYTPKTVDGKSVPGSYTDAFTFRMSANTTDGLPKPIH